MNVDLFAVIGRLHVENSLLREENEFLRTELQRMNEEAKSADAAPAA